MVTENPCIDTDQDEFYDEEFWEAYDELQNGELYAYDSVDDLIDDIMYGPEE